MKLNIGVIGLGDAWEHQYRAALRQLSERFEVRAVCDPVADRAKLAAAEFHADVVDGFRSLADREDVEAVLLLGGAWYGTLPVFATCDAGKAIYLAAGTDIAHDEASRIRDRVLESGVALMVESPRRLAPATLRLKELIATCLGPPRLLFCHQRMETRRSPIATDADTSCPQRVVRRDLVELVDWCAYVVGGPPQWVTGLIHHPNDSTAPSDYQAITLDFSNTGPPGTGAIAQISRGRYVPSAWSEVATYRPVAAMQISCERGIAFVDLPSTLVWFDRAGRHQESLDEERPVGEQLLTRFHRAVTSLVTKVDGLDETCLALQVVDQAAQSHAEGRRLPLS